jgi:SsrA-binding protein
LTRRWRASDFCKRALELKGTEVKSLRKGQANIAESYASAEDGGIFLINAHIPEYQGAGRFFQHEPRRKRRLLLHKKEMAKLATAVERKGMTVVPLELYFNARGIAKLKLAVAKGKKLHDKRETEKKRDWNREKARLMREKG